jgi:hypothetical protein
MFSNIMEHLEADDWLATIEKKLDMVQFMIDKKFCMHQDNF